MSPRNGELLLRKDEVVAPEHVGETFSRNASIGSLRSGKLCVPLQTIGAGYCHDVVLSMVLALKYHRHRSPDSDGHLF